MIKLVDLLDEGIFDMFNKKEPAKPAPKPYKPSRPEYIINDIPITIEGISDGYKVWKGNDPIGDIRQDMNGGKGFGTLNKNGKTYIYYYNADVIDYVGRKAYFTVSSPDPNSKATIEKVANEIEIKAIKNRMVNPYNL